MMISFVKIVDRLNRLVKDKVTQVSSPINVSGGRGLLRLKKKTKQTKRCGIDIDPLF